MIFSGDSTRSFRISSEMCITLVERTTFEVHACDGVEWFRGGKTILSVTVERAGIRHTVQVAAHAEFT